MTWLRSLIRSLLGHTRYHDQAGQVTAATLRAHVLAQRLEVLQRGKR